MAQATTNVQLGSGLVTRVQDAWARFKTARKLRSAYFETVTELEKLDNRELCDLGIARSDIVEIARRHVYGV